MASDDSMFEATGYTDSALAAVQATVNKHAKRLKQPLDTTLEPGAPINDGILPVVNDIFESLRDNFYFVELDEKEWLNLYAGATLGIIEMAHNGLTVEDFFMSMRERLDA